MSLISKPNYKKPIEFLGKLAGREDHSGLQTVLISFALLPVFLYFLLIHVYCVNIPREDDFTILSFIIHLEEKEGFGEKFKYFFTQQGEHRVAIPRLIFFLCLQLKSHIDFKNIIFAGNAALLGLLFLFYRLIPAGQRKLPLLIFLSYTIFQMQHWEATAWAVVAVQNYPTVLFAGLAFYFFNRPNAAGLTWSLIFAVLATSTSGGGVLVLISGMAYFVLARNLKHGCVWFSVSLVSLTFYFYHYVKPAGHPDMLKTLLDPLTLLSYIFSFLGGALSMDNHYFVPLAPIGGLLGCLYFIYLTWKKYYLKNPAIYCFILFIILLAASTALSRSGFGLHQAFTSRYKIFSVSFLILICFSLLELFPPKEKKSMALVNGYLILFAIVFNLISFPRNFEHFQRHTQYLPYDLRNWAMGIKPKWFNGPVLVAALDKGLYRIPCDKIPFRPEDRAKWCK